MKIASYRTPVINCVCIYPCCRQRCLCGSPAAGLCEIGEIAQLTLEEPKPHHNEASTLFSAASRGQAVHGALYLLGRPAVYGFQSRPEPPRKHDKQRRACLHRSKFPYIGSLEEGRRSCGFCAVWPTPRMFGAGDTGGGSGIAIQHSPPRNAQQLGLASVHISHRPTTAAVEAAQLRRPTLGHGEYPSILVRTKYRGCVHRLSQARRASWRSLV
jgi:hypothetical protein